jgi:NAD-dependent deacetylase
MLVIGTSAMVYPAASIPEIAHDAGARVVEINPSETPLTGRISSYIVKGSSGEVLERVVQQLQSSAL